ncbi:MAG TPA: hypothetical protein PLD73_16430 [Candidatus Hydrogenedentes bacterium]|jgi:hypothetical protein|nr:hypothetical protein [Candidatus Hydrogenedentota bacterium]HPJ98657.1 hypothetical protein [Candidatus Hydrogenedentota bacterium]
MQLEFPWYSTCQLRETLEQRSGLRLELTLTDNVHNLLSVRPSGARGQVKVRLHHLFLAADDSVLDALATWISRPEAKRAGTLLDDFIQENHHKIRQAPDQVRIIRIRTRGQCFNLKKLFDEVNQRHFSGTIKAAITWGRMPTVRPQRSIRFGSYSSEFKLIRIHPFLDRPFVPDFFVRYIVFHEMLHAHLGVVETEDGRHLAHTPEFRALERAYPDYDRAVAWQKNRSTMRRLFR